MTESTEIKGYDGEVIAVNFKLRRALSERSRQWLQREVSKTFGQAYEPTHQLAFMLLKRIVESSPELPHKPGVAGDACQIFNAIMRVALDATWPQWLEARLTAAYEQLQM